MALPRKLKNFNLFNDGDTYAGQVNEITLPKLSRKMEPYQGGGMSGPVDVDYGQEGIELDWTCGGLMRGVLAQYGITTHNGCLLRFVGAYQREDSPDVDAVEIVLRGRHKEIEPGKAKKGDDTEFTVKTTASYYKLMVNGATLIELDFVNMIEIVDGVDRLASQRAAIGV